MNEQRKVCLSAPVVLIALLTWAWQEVALGQSPRGSIAEIPEVFRTQDWPMDEIDSVAVWRDGKGSGLLFITAKAADAIHVCDAATGKFVRTIRGEYDSAALGSFNRPNSVGVFQDFLFIVERDNHRVQVLRISSFETLFTFGDDCLALPYGNAIVGTEDGCRFYVTDNYELTQEGGPSSLTERVKEFEVKEKDGKIEVELVRSFGDADGPGALNVVESIVADPVKELLLIADETKRVLRLYDLDGHFTGDVVGKGIIKVEPEGMVVIPGGDGQGGYVLVTDQGDELTILHVLSREDYRYLGSITGNPTLAATDGIAFQEGDFGPFKGGALYCVHQDTRVHAYSWDTIKEKVGLAE
jgi:3-phytase